MRVSIALAAYNGEKYLRQQMDSILDQTVRDFELVVCDDCSTDSTWEILREYQQQDPRVRCYQNAENLGVNKNFEKAVTLCRGEFIAFSDQDDVWTRDHLAVLLDNIGAYSLVCSQSDGIDQNGARIERSLQGGKDYKLMKLSRDEVFFSLLVRNFAQGCTALITRELAELAFPAREEVDWYDWRLARIAASVGAGTAFVEAVTVRYRYHDSNAFGYVTDRALPKKERNQKLLAALFNRARRLYTEYGETLSERQKNICGELCAYCYWTVMGKRVLKRARFFTAHYYVLYYWEHKVVSSILFPARLFKRLVFPACVTDKQAVEELFRAWHALYRR
jgi:glycosyltransferase involved in cell wall biosynthesis